VKETKYQCSKGPPWSISNYTKNARKELSPALEHISHTHTSGIQAEVRSKIYLQVNIGDSKSCINLSTSFSRSTVISRLPLAKSEGKLKSKWQD
jgi:hypothetical protein